jgi:hypothetical protein
MGREMISSSGLLYWLTIVVGQMIKFSFMISNGNSIKIF